MFSGQSDKGQLLIFVMSLLTALLVIGTTTTALSGEPDFGPNVLIFDPSMPTSDIQAAVDAIANQQVDDEMGTGRYTLLFKPGTYGTADQPLWIQVGYYTEVAGLGLSPEDVVINGHIDVYNRCLTPDYCVALDNFWRSLSNLTINVTAKGENACRDTANFWAASQAAPIRRVNITGGDLSLMDYCSDGPQFASGGYIANSQAGKIVNGSQQQFLVRDSSINSWSNGVWNQVFSGVEGAPPTSFPDPPYTTLDTSPVIREKPFLYVDSNGDYRVFVPELRHDTAGTTWGDGPAPGYSIPIDDFLIVTPKVSVKDINKALKKGENVIFTPGIYEYPKAIKVKNDNQVLLGMGYATIIPTKRTPAIEVNSAGVRLAALLIDAGPKNAKVLVKIGTKNHKGGQNNPTSLHDVFFRIGGASVGKAKVSLLVKQDYVILDHIWAWRADHGIAGVGWDINTANTGVVVKGDHVTAYGLFVEHYQKLQVIWKGEFGRTIFFQNELPYDPPTQEDWMDHGINGYAAYTVDDRVEHHEAWGLGSYSNFTAGPDIRAERAFEVPVTPGVNMHSLLTVFLNNFGGIDHVINDVGAAVDATHMITNIVSYP